MNSHQNQHDQDNRGRYSRKLRNMVLQPMLQSKIGIYCIILSLVFAIALSLTLYFNFSNLWGAILELTDVPEDIKEVVNDYWSDIQFWIYLMFAVYTLSTVAISVWFTHSLVGPTIAFKRHLEKLAQGDYKAKTYLRKGDAFLEIADALNHLSESLNQKKTDDQ